MNNYCNHACGFVKTQNFEYAIVVAGSCQYHIPKAELLYFDSKEWVTTNSLPVALYDASSVQLKETFLVIGGLDQDHNTYNSIYYLEYSSASLEYVWKMLEAKLKEARFDFAAFLVPDYLTVC